MNILKKISFFIICASSLIIFFHISNPVLADDKEFKNTEKINIYDVVDTIPISNIDNVPKILQLSIANAESNDTEIKIEYLDEIISEAKINEKIKEEIIYAKEENKETPEEEHVRLTQELRNKIVNEAYSWVGVTPYVSAGRSLYAGTDCSGFTNLIYALYGIQLPTGSDAYQSNVGRHVNYSDLLPGDIIVYRYGGHVAIYIGNDTIIHCANPSAGTIVSSMYNETPTAYVRVIE